MACYLVVDLETSQSWGGTYGFQVGSKHTSSIRLDCQGTKGVEPGTSPHHDLNHTAGFFVWFWFIFAHVEKNRLQMCSKDSNKEPLKKS